jgi:hypothetical protein
VKRKNGSSALIVATQFLVAVLVIAARLPAQQAAPSQAVKQEVPNSMVPIPPPAQPIAYSHKKHLALGLPCQFCHTNPDPGKLMTFPATSKCMGCHATIAKDKPAIRQLAKFAKSPEPIPWVRVYVAASFVRWSHRPHVDAGLKCEMCHGQVAEMEVMAQTTVVTSMYGCIGCHELHKTKTGCDTCHN